MNSGLSIGIEKRWHPGKHRLGDDWQRVASKLLEIKSTPVYKDKEDNL